MHLREQAKHTTDYGVQHKGCKWGDGGGGGATNQIQNKNPSLTSFTTAAEVQQTGLAKRVHYAMGGITIIVIMGVDGHYEVYIILKKREGGRESSCIPSETLISVSNSKVKLIAVNWTTVRWRREEEETTTRCVPLNE